MSDAKRRAMIFVDDPKSSFIPKTADDKFNDWIQFNREGKVADIQDIKITQAEGLPTRITVLYTLD